MQKNTYFRSWLDDLNLSSPLTIAGPCSAETQEQILETALQISKETKIDFFRAGIWKPRTRPGGFEGIGEMGLQWLQEVRNTTGLKIATEIANPYHAELALKHDIDLLWIGARTSVSPFIVQEIAQALQGTDKIILVKNPVNPDLALWIGALERLHQANITKLGAIHRGFSSYQKTKYRNIPEWQIPIELKKLFPNLPLINDPSHISGNRDFIFQIAQTALDLNFDGLMIETHCNPEKAWSDAPQQVTPLRLNNILQKLVVRNVTSSEEDYQQKINELRSEIDNLDAQLLEVLKKRMELSDEIGTLKKNKNIAVLQNERWEKILTNMTSEGKTKGISPEFIEKIFKTIHQESINRQEEILLT